MIWCFREKLLPLSGGEPVEDRLGRIVNDVAGYKRVLYAFRPFLSSALAIFFLANLRLNKGPKPFGRDRLHLGLGHTVLPCCRKIIPKPMRFS
jgi:hypothetical protein